MGEYNPHIAPSLDGKIIKDDQNGQFLTVSGTTPVALMGNRQGRQGFYVAKAGHDVRTATADELIFNSDQNVFKVVASGTGQAPSVTTVADGTNTYSGFATNSYPHHLTFTPLVMAFVEVSSTQYSLMPYSEVVSASSPNGGLISEIYRITTTSTDVEIFHYVVSYSPGVGAGTYSAANVRYYLLQETAA